jgi:methionyl-tRNA formyltransferase
MGMTAHAFVMVGGNVESAAVLDALLAEGLIPRAVVVPAGNLAARTSDLDIGMIATAERAGVTVVRTENINSTETVAELESLDPEYIYVTGWSQLLTARTIAVASTFVVGSHPSSLPDGRGRAPLPWTVLSGAEQLHVTLFRMTPGVDDGSILHQERVDISSTAHVGEIYEDVAAALGRSFVAVTQALSRDPNPPGAAQHGDGTYRHGRTDVDGFLHFQESAAQLDRIVRAVSWPYPCAWGVVAGREVRIGRSAGVKDFGIHQAVPGTVVTVEAGVAWVATGDGLLGVTDVREPDGTVLALRRGGRFDLVGGATMRAVLELRERVDRLESSLSRVVS